eukprot:XP_011661474.1 PREDICTED: uncharacterized protein LOC105437027 [Strongylocentrotus purpuratus]
MPNLTDLKLRMEFTEEFYSTLKAKASSLQVKTLDLHFIKFPSPAPSHHLVEALCTMPNLIDLTLNGGDLNEEFCSALKAKAPSLQVQTLVLVFLKCPKPASPHHLVEALCSMPNLTNLTLTEMDCNEKFYSTLKANASLIQVQTLGLDVIHCPTPASSHHMAEVLCSMPNLTDLTLKRWYLNEKFYSTLSAKASTIQLQTLMLNYTRYPRTALSHQLAEALCTMPNLTNLKLTEADFTEEFCSTLKAKASFIQVYVS